MSSRTSDYPIDSQFLDRWSPRAFTGESITDKDLSTILEAARWAPSSMNEQPWRFIVSTRNSQSWKKFLELLVPFNQVWVEKTGAMVLIAARKNFEKDDAFNINHGFDAGAAWMSMALQARKLGLYAHAMAGFDYVQAQKTLNIPENFQVLAMVAIGKMGKIESLPEKLREREIPSTRKPFSKIVFYDQFKE